MRNEVFSFVGSVSDVLVKQNKVVRLLKQDAEVCARLDLTSSIDCLAKETLHLLQLVTGGNKNAVKLVKATGFLLKVVTTFLDLQVDLLDAEPQLDAVLGLVLELQRCADLQVAGTTQPNSFDRPKRSGSLPRWSRPSSAWPTS